MPVLQCINLHIAPGSSKLYFISRDQVQLSLNQIHLFHEVGSLKTVKCIVKLMLLVDKIYLHSECISSNQPRYACIRTRAEYQMANQKIKRERIQSLPTILVKTQEAVPSFRHDCKIDDCDVKPQNTPTRIPLSLHWHIKQT